MTLSLIFKLTFNIEAVRIIRDQLSGYEFELILTSFDTFEMYQKQLSTRCDLRMSR